MSASSSNLAPQCNEAQLVESTETVASSEIALSVRNLGKSYRLWNTPQDRLKQPLRSMFSQWLPIPHKQYFNEFWALRDINFDVKKGETLGIIGRNGSGKSTLLQILCGTLAPTCGSYETRGRISALLELGSGFNPEFTGRDNVYMNASILGLTKEEIDERYESIVEFADIGQFIDQPVKTYSSGMYVRLAFAVAISVDPDILVVDEALAVGDVFFVQKCMRWMRSFRERGTLLLVSHDTGAVRNLCDKAILLDLGKILSQGNAKDVSDSYKQLECAHFSAQSSVRSAEFMSQQATALTSGVGNPGICQPPKDNIDEPESLNSWSDAEDGSFGFRGAEITSVRLLDAIRQEPLYNIRGDEEVTLEIFGRANKYLKLPMVGFSVHDRLGQNIFADNTYSKYYSNPPALKQGQGFCAQFSFRMPILAPGDYSVTVAIAEGNQSDHIHHHWIHEAMIFKSTADLVHGLMTVKIDECGIVIEAEIRNEGLSS